MFDIVIDDITKLTDSFNDGVPILFPNCTLCKLDSTSLLTAKIIAHSHPVRDRIVIDWVMNKNLRCLGEMVGTVD